MHVYDAADLYEKYMNPKWESAFLGDRGTASMVGWSSGSVVEPNCEPART
jgi:hypothetical protein